MDLGLLYTTIGYQKVYLLMPSNTIDIVDFVRVVFDRIVYKSQFAALILLDGVPVAWPGVRRRGN